MKKKFTVEKVNDLWKVNYENEEWLFQSLEDVGAFMEDFFDSLEENAKELYEECGFHYYNMNKNDNSIN